MATETKTGLKHLGVIADGNRRWAKEQGLPTIKGHSKGIDVIEALTEAAGEAGLEYVTFYVFSTENWGRSEEEVSYIMNLVETRILEYVERLAQKNARFLALGSRKKLSDKVLRLLDKAEKMTEKCTELTVCFCFNYGGQQEIADAATEIIREAADGPEATALPEMTVTPEMIREHLYHPEIPDVDLVVRTSGEQRISGFMLWRAAYAEFLFLDKYFPDMTKEDMPKIIAEYEKRQRRFGK